jgi:hypothetical protein
MVVELRRHGVARQLVDAAAQYFSVTLSSLAWTEPFTDSCYLLARLWLRLACGSRITAECAVLPLTRRSKRRAERFYVQQSVRLWT